jgi:hypothetical protein
MIRKSSTALFEHVLRGKTRHTLPQKIERGHRRRYGSHSLQDGEFGTLTSVTAMP